MKNLVEQIINCGFDEISHQVFPMNKMFGLVVEMDGVKYEFLLNLKATEKILILGSGARNPNTSPEDKKRPLFHRWSWEFNHSTIFYNDPTLYLSPELLGGWGLGTCDNWYLRNISLILEKILANVGIENKNVLFYGSSSGGFNSVMLSVLMKDTTSLAEIPQFDVTKWGYHWNALRKVCFNNLPEEIIRKEYGYKVDVLELIKKEQYIPNAFVILDCSSSYDYQNIYLPFFNRLDELPFDEKRNKIKIRIDGKNRGHSILDYQSIFTTIDNVMFINDNSYYKNKDKKIKKLEKLLESKENDLRVLNDSCNEKAERINQLEQFKKDVLSSRSWQYTEFFRKLKR